MSRSTARLDSLAGSASVVVALAGIVYGASGAAATLLSVLRGDVGPLGTTDVSVFDFVQSAAWTVGLGAFACLAAAVLAKTYSRLTVPPAPEDDSEDDDDLGLEGAGLFTTVVSTLAICFAVAWIAVSLLIAWKTRDLGEGLLFTEADEGLGRLYAYQSAAAAATLGSVVVMGSLLMARAHDRLAGVR